MMNRRRRCHWCGERTACIKLCALHRVVRRALNAVRVAKKLGQAAPVIVPTFDDYERFERDRGRW
jgi:hypothetical protein